MKNNFVTKFYEQVANLATGAVDKADCSSTGFFPISQTNLITIFVCLSFLPVSFFFYLLSLMVNKTVQQEKLLKTKTNIVGLQTISMWASSGQRY